MIGIIFATIQEARPFLARTGASQSGAAPFRLFGIGTQKAMLAVSGMGKVAAALATQMLIRERHCDRILNAGTCGALIDRADLLPGNIFRISSVSEGPPGPGIPSGTIRSAGGIWQDMPTARLVTVEQPVFNSAARRRLAAWGELVDMEGAVVARVAKLYGVPWDMIKGITDSAEKGQRPTLHHNLATVSEAVAECLSYGIMTYDTSER